MLQLMARPVAAVCPATGQPVVREAARPHHFRTGVIIVRLLHQDLRVLHHRADQILADAVRQFHIVRPVKISLHRVHHNIHAPACRLVLRQSHSQYRIHDREFCAAVITVIASLQPAVLIRDNRRVAHLRTGRRDRQYDADRKTTVRLTFSFIKIPHIAIIVHAVADGLGGIDHTAPADGKNKVRAFLFTQFNPFIYEGQPRVRHHAAK